MDRARAEFPEPHHGRRYHHDRVGRRVPWTFDDELLEAAKGGRSSRGDVRGHMTWTFGDGLLEVARGIHRAILPSCRSGSCMACGLSELELCSVASCNTILLRKADMYEGLSSSHLRYITTSPSVKIGVMNSANLPSPSSPYLSRSRRPMYTWSMSYFSSRDLAASMSRVW